MYISDFKCLASNSNPLRFRIEKNFFWVLTVRLSYTNTEGSAFSQIVSNDDFTIRFRDVPRNYKSVHRWTVKVVEKWIKEKHMILSTLKRVECHTHNLHLSKLNEPRYTVEPSNGGQPIPNKRFAHTIPIQ